MLRGAFLKWQQGGLAHWCSYSSTSRRFSWRIQREPDIPGIALRSSLNPQIPLSERPATWTSTEAELCSWHTEALNRLRDVGDSLSVDGGPSRDDLELELQWIMEDAVVGWKDNVLSGIAKGEELVRLRISLHDLGTFLVWISYHVMIKENNIPL